MLSASNDRLIKLILIILLNLILPVASSDSNQTDNETISLFSSPSVPLVIVNPGDSIQDAIEESEPGCVIEVHGGVYSESINISKRISIRGIDDGDGLPLINAQENGSAINVFADGVRLENLTINGSVFKDAGVNVTSINCTIKSINGKNNHYEIESVGLNNTFFNRNNLTDNGQDIRLLSSYNNSLSITDTTKNGLGIDLTYSRNNSNGWNSQIIDSVGTEPRSNDSNYLMENETIGYGYVSGINPFKSENYDFFGNNLSNHSYGITLNSSINNLLSKNITYPEGNNIFPILNNYTDKIEYKFEYNSKTNNGTIEAKDSAGWTNRSGARRNDWEYEALDSGKTLVITDDLRDGERILPAGGLEGEWLPCGFSEKRDEVWPSLATVDSVNENDDKERNKHKKPAQYASNQPESNGIGSEKDEPQSSDSIAENLLETQEAKKRSQEEFASLALGQLVFTAPKKMRKGEEKTVTARISENLSEDLRKGLDETKRAEIKVGLAMEVELSGDKKDFIILPSFTEDHKIQYFPSDNMEWEWKVTPLNKGNHNLTLTAWAIIKADEKHLPIKSKSYEEEILVEVNWQKEVENALFGGGTWILILFVTALATGIINWLSGGIINRVKSLGKEKPSEKSGKNRN